MRKKSPFTPRQLRAALDRQVSPSLRGLTILDLIKERHRLQRDTGDLDFRLRQAQITLRNWSTTAVIGDRLPKEVRTVPADKVIELLRGQVRSDFSEMTAQRHDLQEGAKDATRAIRTRVVHLAEFGNQGRVRPELLSAGTELVCGIPRMGIDAFGALIIDELARDVPEGALTPAAFQSVLNKVDEVQGSLYLFRRDFKGTDWSKGPFFARDVLAYSSASAGVS